MRLGGDGIFFMLALAAMVFMGAAAARTWRHATLTELSKSQAEQLSHWMAAAHAADRGQDFLPQACAAPQPLVETSPRWGACAQALMAEAGPLGAMRNAFTGAPLQLIDKCKPGQAATVGQLVLEKLMPPVPGTSTPPAAVPLAESDALAPVLALRLQVCDAAGYAIHVADLEF